MSSIDIRSQKKYTTNQVNIMETKHTDDIPIIKLFSKNEEFYVYDTYQNVLLNIQKKHYIELQKLSKIGLNSYLIQKTGLDEKNDLQYLMKKGFFSCKIVEDIQHPESTYSPELIEQCVGYLQLQVTQNCNFSCRYCAFASNTQYTRGHSLESMSVETAKKAVDFLYEHSSSVPEIRISFYGGEPLLNFHLIQQTVEYAEKRFSLKNIRYFITTNLSILNQKIIELFIKHSFNLLISFDGGENIQDKHRRFQTSGGKTFDHVLRNIISLRDYDATYFREKVRFNSVLFNDEKREDVYSFFDSIQVPRNAVSVTSADTSGIDYQLSHLWETSKIAEPIIVEDAFQTKELLDNRIPINKRWHPNGTCIPGIGRMLIDVHGNIYLCEKVIETTATCIGSIETGFNVNRILEIQNIAKLTESECKHCWAMRFCKSCICHCTDAERNDLSYELKKEHCAKEKKRIERNIYKLIELYQRKGL